MQQAPDWLTPAARRGFLRIVLASAAVGFALGAQQNIVANYFAQVLNLEGPQFGYITAIREIPGFLLIFLTALFYRLDLPRLTAGALVLLAIGYALFGVSDSFWSVAPWVIISSIGYHTFFQNQHALGMTLTTEKRAGTILGQLTSWYNIGTLIAMSLVFLVFQFNLLDFRAMFVICGVVAFVGAVAIYRFPNMIDGKPMARPQKREPIVLRREYGYYYALNLLDGGRQQIFFSFGLYVLVAHYKMTVPQISAVLIATTILNIFVGSWIGRQVDKRGEKPILMLANVGYVVALAGYALIDNIYVAVLCYVIYTVIFPLSGIGASTYLRKVAVQSEIAPSLAMGVTLQHVAAIVVPLATGYVLNFVGYQVPFLIACVFACFTFVVTRRLAPERQRSPRRVAEDAQVVQVGAIP